MNLLCLYQQFSLFKWVVLYCFFSVGQHLKNDLMRQFDSQVNDFVDSLIEESATLEPAPLPAVFSPPLSDKERIKLGCCHLNPSRKWVFFLLSGKKDWCHCLFFAGIFDLPTAKASSLSVAGPSWSKSAGASGGTATAVFPLAESVWNAWFEKSKVLTCCCCSSLQWAVWGEPHQDHLPHVYCSAHSLHPQHSCGWFHWWRKVSKGQDDRW